MTKRPNLQGHSNRGGYGECSICTHPNRDEIDAMILNGTVYGEIIARMQTLCPGRALTKPSLSRHKTNHLLNQPITVVDESGERTTYLTGVIRSDTLSIPPEALPGSQVTLQEALDVIIAAGVLKILNDPSLVSPRTLIEALDLKHRTGNSGDAAAEFEAAWTDPEFLQKKLSLKQAALARKRRKVRRSVTFVEESDMENSQDTGDAIEGEIVPPLLEETDDDLSSAFIPSAASVREPRAED